MAFALPIDLPTTLEEKRRGMVTLPITLPFGFSQENDSRVSTIIEITEKVNLSPKQGKIIVPLQEKATGKNVTIPFVEKAWKFEGLILQENIITEASTNLTVTENIQALVLADFELISPNEVKISWYGNSVPSVQIMKKPMSDETYTNDGTYSWASGSAITHITNEDYNIYLLGTSNSGMSAIYSIAGTNDTIVVPEVGVLVNEKLYTTDIDYESVFKLDIDY